MIRALYSGIVTKYMDTSNIFFKKLFLQGGGCNELVGENK